MRIEECHTEDLDSWITERHYLQSTPPGARLRLWFRDESGRIIGAMMWGRPSARLLNQKTILELTRMYFITNTDPFVESQALGKARKHIRKNMPQIKGLLAYSSVGQGHNGTIYRADGWFTLGAIRGSVWTREKRPRADRDNSDKIRWVRSP